MSFVFVALGGAIGAVARYAISLIPVKSQFPILTLVTNILGAVLIAILENRHLRWIYDILNLFS